MPVLFIENFTVLCRMAGDAGVAIWPRCWAKIWKGNHVTIHVLAKRMFNTIKSHILNALDDSMVTDQHHDAQLLLNDVQKYELSERHDERFAASIIDVETKGPNNSNPNIEPDLIRGKTRRLPSLDCGLICNQ